MKKLSRFKLAYLIFLAACILLSAVFLIYVGFVVKEFDSAQPERVVERQIAWLTDKAADNTLAEELDFVTICSNRYENNSVDFYSESYTGKIKGAELTYEYAASQSSELSKTYNILADGSPVGTVSLSGDNCRNKLFFFSMADWHIDSFEPILSDTVYNLLVYKPEGTEVFINGWQPSPGELDPDSEIPAYSIKGLLNEPEIEYRREDGSSVPFTSEKNVIKPVLYSYQFTIPSGISVSADGEKLSGEPASGGQSRYVIQQMSEPEITFTDLLGNSRKYGGEEAPEFFSCDVVIPEGYRLSVNGIDADTLCEAASSPNPDAEFLLDKAGVILPDQKTYSLSLLEPGVNAVVTDENGNQKEYPLNQQRVEISSLGEGIPEDIAAQIDVLETAKDWSRFMTDDLPGQMHGLYSVQEFLIKDSEYYNFAYQWATSIDITFTSTHTIDSFTGDRVTNFTQYNENCFSCEVYFEKNMSLYRGAAYVGARTDVFSSIMYFVNIDDTPENGVDDPHWAIAVMHDVL